MLSNIWNRGTTTLGPLTFATSSYTAGYVLKKQTSANHTRDLAIYGDSLEPLVLRRQEFNTMSRRPGLGYDWFQKYWPDVYPSDSVQIEGKTYRPPSYYDRLLLERDPGLHGEVLARRKEFVDKRGLTSEYELRARSAILAGRTKDKKQRGDL